MAIKKLNEIKARVVAALIIITTCAYPFRQRIQLNVENNTRSIFLMLQNNNQCLKQIIVLLHISGMSDI